VRTSRGQSPAAQLRKLKTIAAMRNKRFGLLFMQKPIPQMCFESMASRASLRHIAQELTIGLLICFTRAIDTTTQISRFGKLKLQSCARAGNRAGLFRFLMTRLD
jgi:hypothetical protein